MKTMVGVVCGLQGGESHRSKRSYMELTDTVWLPYQWLISVWILRIYGGIASFQLNKIYYKLQTNSKRLWLIKYPPGTFDGIVY